MVSDKQENVTPSLYTEWEKSAQNAYYQGFADVFTRTEHKYNLQRDTHTTNFTGTNNLQKMTLHV